MLISSPERFLRHSTDPFYQHLDASKAQAAGWVEMSSDSSALERALDTKLLTSNLSNVRNNVLSMLSATNSKLLYLVTSGSFAPLHQGHLAMMTKTKKYFENLGYTIIGGMLSPSHDSYVTSKLGCNNYDIYTRIEDGMKLINEASESDWLIMDCWEGLILDQQINFSFLLERVRAYIYHYIPELLNLDFEVVYVFGDDNCAFIDAFDDYGMCACVYRNLKEMLLKQSSPRVHYINTPCPHTRLSSSNIRNAVPATNTLFEIPRIYVIRDDAFESVAGLKVSVESVQVFKNKIVEIFSHYFENNPIDVKFLKYQLPPGLSEPIISLDPWIEGHHNLNVSRLFNLGDGQFNIVELVNSCGEESILSQIQKIPKNEYVLVDDDIATGFTMNNIHRLLLNQSNANIIQTTCLLDVHKRLFKAPILEIADCRDFIIGSQHGGLTVKIFNDLQVRVPYIYPYVNLRARSSVSNHLSKDILSANVELFRQNIHICLSDIPEYSRIFFQFLGFSDSDSLYNISLWHLRMFYHENT